MARQVHFAHGARPVLDSAARRPILGEAHRFFVIAFGLKFIYFYVGDRERGLRGTLGDRMLDEATGACYMLLAAVALALLLRRLPPPPPRA